MNERAWSSDEEVRLAEYLVAQVSWRASGRLEAECLANPPHDRYFVGSLRPRDDVDTFGPRGINPELLTKLAPSAMGMEIRVGPNSATFSLGIDLEWACYYRVFPSYEEQVEHQRHLSSAQAAEAAADDESVGDEDAASEPEGSDADDDDQLPSVPISQPPGGGTASRRRRPSDSLFVRFRKIDCHVRANVVVARSDAGLWEPQTAELVAGISAEMARARAAVRSDPQRLRTSAAAAEPVRVPEAALGGSAAYVTFLNSLRDPVEPEWNLDVAASVARTIDGNEVDLSLQFVNSSPRLLTRRGRESLNTETFLFDVRCRFGISDAEPRPFEIALAPRGFRYDRELWGRGFNVEVIREDPTTFRTEAAPVYRQARHVTRSQPDAAFADLVTDPVPVLQRVAQAMRDYVDEWDRAEGDYRRLANWGEFAAEFTKDRDQFAGELDRFLRGVDLIERDPDVNLAFRLTNETFRRGANSAWRLFQLVFLVSQMPGAASLASGQDVGDRDFVDIIFFPTAGGKTEAYLAAIVFNCFLDRLRGKTAGVTAWIRFPLRLLTLQQTQRIAAAVAHAELVRRESSDSRLTTSDPFAVGYLVGQDGSPNEIADPNSAGRYGARFAAGWSQAQDPIARQKWKRIARCPSCGTKTVRVDFDPGAVKVMHVCSNATCAFAGGVLPIYVIDNEIYRYLPPVMVGTIDKLAGIGNQRKMSLVFGQVDGSCSLHGYYFRRCTQAGCRDGALLRPSRPPGLTGPTLFVQDELHLLSEGLGTFDGHYETFVQELSRHYSNPTIKIVASSATIEAFGRQVEHLFGRQASLARIFPGPGPRLSASFYAESLERPQRLFVGVLPHNKTIFNAVLELLELYHRAVAQLVSMPVGAGNPYGGSVAPGSEVWARLLDFYQTSLTYFINKRELDSVSTDVEGDLNPNLVADALPPVHLLTLTGGVGTDEVEQVLEHIDKARTPAERHGDAVLATSMVSHGVDVDRLNMMLFFGMPRLTSEYIQASSRVGRALCGIVFVGLHPARERDQSHYQYFSKYHEFLGQLVEPVAINRWAKFAIDRTMPGLFMAVVLQVLAINGPEDPNKFYMVDTLKRKIAMGDIKVDDFAPMLAKAYFGESATEALAEIETRVRRYLDQLIDSPGSVSLASDALIPKPMRSLREVDEQIEIEMDSAAASWAARS